MKECQLRAGGVKTKPKNGEIIDSKGPVKIKDGLFMGDREASEDLDFMISNKVSRVINTVWKKIPNHWEKLGVQYLSVNWTNKEKNVFDPANNTETLVFDFIEEAMENGESCLVHSYYGKTRATTVMASYLMVKYSWSLRKALQFIGSKKANFMKQLQRLQLRLKKNKKLSSSWNECHNHEQLTLANTLINSQPIFVADSPKKQKKNSKQQKKVKFDNNPIIHKIPEEIEKKGRQKSLSQEKGKDLKLWVKKSDLNSVLQKESDYSKREKKERNRKNEDLKVIFHLHQNQNHNITVPLKKTAIRPFSSDQKLIQKYKDDQWNKKQSNTSASFAPLPTKMSVETLPTKQPTQSSSQLKITEGKNISLTKKQQKRSVSHQGKSTNLLEQMKSKQNQTSSKLSRKFENPEALLSSLQRTLKRKLSSKQAQKR